MAPGDKVEMTSTKKKRSKDKNKRKKGESSAPDDMSMMPSDGSFDERAEKSFASTYQVGDIDENGFVHIGIEERQMHPKQDVN